MLVFRAFYCLVRKAPFFTFDRRGTDVSCIQLVPSSSRDKYWKKKFFYIDVVVVPGNMVWRKMALKEKVKGTTPTFTEYQNNALFKALSAHPSITPRNFISSSKARRAQSTLKYA
ncbi:hypothetical protein Hanom_Chr11g01008481 [Helianthus anomalus]